VVPAVGGAASFGIIAFMNPLSILWGGVVLLIAALWYAVYVRPLSPPDSES
jgi:hypothetical protein